jgi:cell division ATPase FtsA
LIQNELRRAGFEEVLSSGIVLTGGASVMPGMVELGEEIFHMPVRLGNPKYTGSLADVVQSPRFSTRSACCWKRRHSASAARRSRKSRVLRMSSKA